MLDASFKRKSTHARVDACRCIYSSFGNLLRGNSRNGNSRSSSESRSQRARDTTRWLNAWINRDNFFFCLFLGYLCITYQSIKIGNNVLGFGTALLRFVRILVVGMLLARFGSFARVLALVTSSTRRFRPGTRTAHRNNLDSLPRSKTAVHDAFCTKPR